MTRGSARDSGGGEDQRASWGRVLTLILGLSLAPAVTIGLARFAYALLLPAMRVDLDWSYALAGGMNTANALGYLLGALLAAPAIAQLGGRKSFAGGFLVTALALLVSSLPTAYGALLTLRLIAGVSGAIAFVAGSVLAAHAASIYPERTALVLGVYYGGAGLGILVSGLAIPALLEVEIPAAWRWAWAGLGVTSLLALGLAGVAAHRLQEPPTHSEREPGVADSWATWPLLPTFLAYFLYGVGYFAYMTFVIAFLQSQGVGAFGVSLFWVVLGLAAIISVPAWGPAIERLRGGRALGMVMAVVTVGAVLPLVSEAPVVVFVSGALFGASFLSVVTTVTVLVRKFLPSHAWSAGIAAFTVVFATGQCLGPVASGVLSDGPGGLEAGILLSAGVLAIGALSAFIQREATL